MEMHARTMTSVRLVLVTERSSAGVMGRNAEMAPVTGKTVKPVPPVTRIVIPQVREYAVRHALLRHPPVTPMKSAFHLWRGEREFAWGRKSLATPLDKTCVSKANSAYGCWMDSAPHLCAPMPWAQEMRRDRALIPPAPLGQRASTGRVNPFVTWATLHAN